MSIPESGLLQSALERLESHKRDIDAEIAELRGRQDYGRVKHRGRPRTAVGAHHGSPLSSAIAATTPRWLFLDR